MYKHRYLRTRTSTTRVWIASVSLSAGDVAKLSVGRQCATSSSLQPSLFTTPLERCFLRLKFCCFFFFADVRRPLFSSGHCSRSGSSCTTVKIVLQHDRKYTSRLFCEFFFSSKFPSVSSKPVSTFHRRYRGAPNETRQCRVVLACPLITGV